MVLVNDRPENRMAPAPVKAAAIHLAVSRSADDHAA
jgi:hypothetical protein